MLQHRTLTLMKMLSSEPSPGEQQIQLCCSIDNGKHGLLNSGETSGMEVTQLCKLMEVNDERLRRSGGGEAPLRHHLHSLLISPKSLELPLASADVRPRPHRDQKEEKKHQTPSWVHLRKLEVQTWLYFSRYYQWIFLSACFVFLK